MAKRTRTRKTKQGLIIKCLEEGISLPVALRLAGVPRSTYYDWLRRYPTFREATERAEGEYLSGLERLAHIHCLQGDSQMIRWLLSKRLPTLYGNRAGEADDYHLVIEEIPSPQDFEVIIRRPEGRES